ncbi:MAG: PKD domain-containing protein [Bacteroidetes bacterium]|nr:PKD domain-containing protein [Bacteroidota bacterium]
MTVTIRIIILMKFITLTIVSFIISSASLYSQCSIAIPVVKDTICPLSINQAQLDSTYVTQVTWDFCPAGLDSLPLNISTTASFGNATRQLQVIYEDGNYYGFTVAPNIDGVQRIDFGNSLSNTPTVKLIASGMMGATQLWAVDIVRKDNAIYIFAADNVQGKLFRLTLSSITDVNPQVKEILAGQITPYAIDIIGEYLFIANYNISNISRLKFTYGFDSIPDILTPIPSPGLPSDITMMYDCVKQKYMAAVVKLISKEVTLLDFGNSFENVPTEKIIYLTAEQDFSIVSAHTREGWYVFCTGTSGFIRGLKLTEAMDSIQTVLFDSDFGVTVGQPIGMSYIDAAGEPQLFVSHYSSGALSRFKFPDPCAVTPHGSFSALTSFSIDTTLGQKIYYTVNYLDSANLPQLTVDSFYTDNTNSEINIALTNNCEGLVAQFNATESICLDTIIFRHWDFGDGAEDSLITNPTHTYATSGTFQVQYYALTSGGDSIYYTLTIEVKQKPTANFTFVNNQCANLNIPFTNTSGQGNDSIVLYNWFINNVEVGNDTILNYTFTSGGQYNITLMVTNTVGCMDSITQVISIADAPQAAFNATNTCIGGQVQFVNATDTNGLNVTYYWDFGDTFFSTDTNPLHSYAGLGADYTVMLIASGSNSCIDTILQNVHLSVKPTPVISIVGNTFCQNQSYTFYDNSYSNGSDSIYYVRWDMGNGDSFISSDSLSYAYTLPGTYTITLTAATPTFCDSAVTASIIINAQPDVQFSAPDGCLGDTVYFINQTTFAQDDTISSYLWFFDYGGITANSNDTLFYYPTFSIYSVSLTAITDKGCADTAYKSLFVYPRPVADFSFTTPVCTNFPAI